MGLGSFIKKAVSAITDNKVVDIVKDAARSSADFSLRTMLPGVYEKMNLDDKWGLSGSNMHTGIGREFNKLAGYAGDAAPWVAAAIGAPYLLGGAGGGAGAFTGAGSLEYGAGGYTGAGLGTEGLAGALSAGGTIPAGSTALAAQLGAGATIPVSADLAALPEGAAWWSGGDWSSAPLTGADKAASPGLGDVLKTLGKGKVALDKVKQLTAKQQQTQQQQAPQINLPATNWMNLGGGANLGDFMSQAMRYNQQQDFGNMLNKKPYGYGGV